MKHTLRLFVFLLFFCLMGLAVKAQQKHFIYVESEDRQPFAIVLNGKVYSSSDYGYIIIPKLDDGDYNFTVSFPMNKFPDQPFACTVSKKDVGYFLKNDNNKWVLQNMQTKKVVGNDNVATAKDTTFSNMLSEVVSDSTLTKQNVVSQSSANNGGGVAVAATGAVVATTVASAPQTDSDVVNQPIKISQTDVDTGTSMQFVDKTENSSDTINIFIPSAQMNATTAANKSAENTIAETQTANPAGAVVIAAPAVAPSINNNNNNTTNDSVTSDTITAVSVNTPTENNTASADTAAHEVSNPFYKPDQTNSNAVAVPAVAAATAVTTSSDAVKQDCQSTLSDDDLNKLKRKMFVQHNDNDMVQTAIKYVQKKCITTDQVKLLGNLFVSDDGRYSLYDALYKYVYDYGKYPELASQIIDPYYKKRFASLLR